MQVPARPGEQGDIERVAQATGHPGRETAWRLRGTGAHRVSLPN
jgi:hypothetical protein